MANTKTVRLTTEQVSWLAETKRESGGLSENQIMGLLIDHAIASGWRPVVRVDAGGWINGPMKDTPGET